MKKVIAFLLIAVMMVTVCACGGGSTTGNETVGGNGSTAPKPGLQIDAGAMILTEMGTVPKEADYVSGGILQNYESTDDGDRIQLLNQNGQAFNDIWYDDINAIARNGICIVENVEESGKKLLGVVDTIREKELLPCEAVQVVKLSERFLLICYMTGEGTEDDRFGTYYIKSENFDYKGYGKILDMDMGQLVPGVEVTTNWMGVSAAGNMLYVSTPEGEAVYKADGTLLGTYEDIYAFPDSGIAVQYTAEGICIYDQDMNLVSTLERKAYGYDYEPIGGTSEMLLHNFPVEKDNATTYGYVVTDLNGKALTKEYDRILEVYPEGYLEVTVDEEEQIVDFNGNVILSGFYSAGYIEPGYFVTRIQDEGYYVHDLTGKKINTEPLRDVSGLFAKDDSGNYLIFETGEMLQRDEGYPQEQLGSLVLIGTTLYDVITGKTVLENVKNCVATGGNLYVWDEEQQVFIRYLVAFKA